MEIEEEVKKETKDEERAIGSIGNVKITGNLVTTKMVDGRTITESFDEIEAKNAEYDRRAKECIARFAAESARAAKAKNKDLSK